jgi:TP901 family phage tail tape measure protein
MNALINTTKQLRTGAKIPSSITNISAAPGGIVSVANSFNRISESAKTAGVGVQTFGQIMTKASTFVRGFGGAIVSAGRRLTTFGAVISSLGTRMSIFISLPIVAGIGAFIKSASDFEDELVKLRTLVGLTSEEIRKMRDNVLALAPALGTAPVDLLAAAYFPLSGGIRDAATASEIMTVASKAAAIGLGDVERIAKTVTSAVVAYGQENLSAARAGDILVTAVQRGALEADDLAEPLGRAIGAASNLGIGLEEVTAFLGTFGVAGVDASQAVTGLNRVMASFLKPTRQAEDALEAIGRDMESARALLDQRGLAGALITLSREFAAAGVPLSRFIGRITGLNAALFLTGNAMELYLQNLAVINTHEGTLDRAFGEVAKTASFQWNQLKATLQATAITIGEVLLPAVNLIVSKIAPMIAAVGRFAAQHPKIVLLAAAFGLVVAVIGPLVLGLGLLISAIGAIITGVGAVISVIGALMGPTLAVVAVITLLAGTITGLYLVSLKKMREKTGQTMDTFAKDAFRWGRNIIVSLAQGIADGAVVVIRALIQIGKVIRSWLMGGSPPKLLPDLPQWGANVINEYIRGFSLADFSIFNEVGDVLELFFRSLGDRIAEEDLVPTILGGREALAEAIRQMREMGSVSEDVMARIGGAFGATSADIQEYIRILFQLAQANEAVAAAQEEVNRINREFESAVAPLNEELQGIADRRQEVVDQLREEELHAILADPRASPLVRELALMELREIELRRQVRAEEDARDAALAAAEAELEAARAEQERLQAAADLQRQLIDSQIEGNRLLQEQIDTLERLAEAMEDIDDVEIKLSKEASKQIADDLSQAISDALGAVPAMDTGLLDFIGEGILGAAEALKNELDSLFAELAEIFAPVLALLDELADVWSDIFLAIRDLDISFKDIIGGAAILIGVFTILKSLLAGRGLIWLFGGLVKAVSGASTAVGGLLLGLGAPFVIALGAAILAIGALIKEFGGVPEAIEGVRATFTGDGAFGPDGPMPQAFDAIARKANVWRLDFRTTLTAWGQETAEKIFSTSDETQDETQSWFDNLIGSLDLWRFDFRNRLIDWGRETFEAYHEAATTTLAAIEQWFDDILASLMRWVVGFLSNLVVWALRTRQIISEWVSDTIANFTQAGGDFVDGMIVGVLSKADALKNTLLAMAKAAWERVKRFFGIESPSTLAMEAGTDIVAGMIRGITGAVPQLNMAIGSALATGTTAIAPAVAAPQAMSNNSFNFGPVNINNGMDEALFEARVRRIMTEATRI